MVAWLFWPEAKLASASFVGFQIWTESWWIFLDAFQNANEVDLMDLRVWLEGLQMEEISESFEQGKLGL